MNSADSEDTQLCRTDRASVALETVGCKLNHAETEAMTRALLAAGFCVVSPEEQPDAYVLNTCTVTHTADRKCRQHLFSHHRLNPGALIIATGCYAERAAAELTQLKGVGLVVDNAGKSRLPEIIADRTGKAKRVDGVPGHLSASAGFRKRASVKIQEGCSRHCTYCVVPRVRGPERSLSPEVVLEEIRARVSEGCREVVITGTQIGTYAAAGGLVVLVQRVLRETAAERIRLSSLMPGDLTPALIQLWKSSARLCRHLHLPLQSGSDSVLQRMGRPYSGAEYAERVASVRAAIPEMAITSDVMVGFPGESAGEFEESLGFCEGMGFARLHVFTYSPREGTAAGRMPSGLTDETRKDRRRRMLDLAWRSARAFSQGFVGRTAAVLWEGGREGELWVGHTDQYLKVFAQSQNAIRNRITLTELVAICEGGLKGKIRSGLAPGCGGRLDLGGDYMAGWPKERGGDD